METIEAIQTFFAYLEKTGRKPRTIEAYKQRLTPLADNLPGKSLEEITSKDLTDFMTTYTGKHSKRINTMTQSTYIQALKTFFQYCLNNDLIKNNPASVLQRPSRSKTQYEYMPSDMALTKEIGEYLTCTQTGSLEIIIDEFIIYLEAQARSPRTIQAYRERLQLMQELFIGRNINTITARDIDYFVMLYRGKVAPATVAGYIQAVKTFFRFCVSRNYIQSSPCQHLKKPKIQPVTRDKVIGQIDLENMIKYTQENGMILDSCLLLFMADTGCRAGELISIDLQNIDLAKCEAVCNGKTGIRYLDFTENTANAIRKWLTIRPRTDTKALFTTREGRISHARIYHGFKRIAAELGIERYNPQSIRHRVGQAWIDAGANLEIVRIKLGHQDIHTTAQFYSHQDRQRMKRASNQFSIIQQG